MNIRTRSGNGPQISIFLLCAFLASCGSNDATSPGNAGSPNQSQPGPTGTAGASGATAATSVPTSPVTLSSAAYSYGLTESTESLTLFTTPATHRLLETDRSPTEKRTGLKLSAAKNEFEPVQLAIEPKSGTLSAKVEPFPNLGTAQRVELSRIGYVEKMADTLTPIGDNDVITRSDAAPLGLWINIYVPKDAPKGLHRTTLVITESGKAPVSIPIELTVFDFALPMESHFSTQFNIGVSSLIGEGQTVTDAKDLLFEHRLTPTSATWPSGFNWQITWDNERSPNRCKTFYDEPDEGADYAVGRLAQRYLRGEGWNDVGFRNAELFQFVSNSTPRPDTFCGVSRGDHYGSAAYNAAWSNWLTALDEYLTKNGLTDRGYYYVQNEPQTDDDDKLAAHLCRLTKAAAPHLRIAISEEPKPSIAEDEKGACGYDIWIAHVRAYEQDYAFKRQRDFGEEVWFYSLDHDPDPYFNPTRPQSPGIHQRIIPWTAWSHRIRGWAYYDGARFFNGARPTIRAELLREGLEDYEYLWLANKNAHPTVDQTSPLDATVRSVAASMTSFTKDVDALMTLRHELGLYLEGTRSSLPTLSVESSRPRASYYINFQDPKGEPQTNPLVVDGHTYQKIGWEPYDAKLGYGWSGEHISDSSIALYGYDDVSGYSVLQKSYLYDDYGRDNLFEFDLAPGRYRITVTVGRPARGYPTDPCNLSIEGIAVIKDEVATNEAPVISRTTTLDITDGRLSLVAAGRSKSTGDYAYTFLSSLVIEPAD